MKSAFLLSASAATLIIISPALAQNNTPDIDQASLSILIGLNQTGERNTATLSPLNRSPSILAKRVGHEGALVANQSGENNTRIVNPSRTANTADRTQGTAPIP